MKLGEIAGEIYHSEESSVEKKQPNNKKQTRV